MDLTADRKAEILRFARELVRRPGFSGDEAGTAEAVARQMRELGYDEVEVDGWGNVIGTIRGAKAGPTLVFDGHMDVVPIRDSEAWTREPYGAEVVDGELWGRGSVDMKGGLAAALCAAAFVDRKDVAGTVLVTATVAEELLIGRGLGKALEGRKVDALVTCEPTGARALAVAGVGRTTVEMNVRGLAAHSSRPGLGDNAVYRAMGAIERIRAMPRRSAAPFGEEVVELVEIRSRPSPGNGCVPDRCWALWECRLLPGETEVSFLGRFRAALEGFDGAEKIDFDVGRIAVDCYTGARLEYEDFLPAWSTPPGSPLRALAELALERSGIDAEPIVFRACTNVNVSAGAMGIPSLIYGPGDLARAHKPDERLAVGELELCAEVYGRMIELAGRHGAISLGDYAR
jgi:putative selenium metabolism hydrolase